MRQFPHIKRNHRSGNWTYFRRFPSALRAGTGRIFFERSLQTADRKLLSEPWIAANREFEAIVAEARATLHPPDCIDTPNNQERLWHKRADWPEPWDGNIEPTLQTLDLRLEEVRTLVADWGRSQRFERAQKLLNDPSFSEDESNFEEECKIVGACGYKTNWLIYSPQLLHLTRKIVNEAGLKIPQWHSAMYKIERMVEAELRATFEAESRWRAHDYSDMPQTLPSHDGNKHSNNYVVTSLSLLELIEKYAHATRKPSKTISKLKLVSGYLNDLNGSDLLAGDITKDLLIRLQTDALKIPARQNAAEKKLSFVDLCKIDQDKLGGRKKLTPQAVRAWFNLLGACLNWGVRADLISINATNGVKPHVKPLEEKPRLPFSTVDLRIIFDCKSYPISSNDEKYWLPLLALYSGARINELGQLLKSDITFDDIPYISINAHAGISGGIKRLKNLSARRIIPIHGNLLALGFETFAKMGTSEHLFEKLPHDGKYEPTKTFSQWFGRHLRSIGITDDRKVFHSFRHSFKDECRRCGVEEEVHDALTGHSAGGSRIGRSYGSGVPIERLADAMSKIYSGLEIVKV